MNDKLIQMHKAFYENWDEPYMRQSADDNEVKQAAAALLQMLETAAEEKAAASVFDQHAAPVNAKERFQFVQEKAGHFTGRLEVCKLAQEMKHRMKR